ncbi:MAG: hypothetical protein H6551_10615 [Chitinophagales bacterium]|nr:hypothetical protein [Chitinophagaceae bacterium]MCB9065581.1 hypothetical protein [Chitinophagales bacterium]
MRLPLSLLIAFLFLLSNCKKPSDETATPGETKTYFEAINYREDKTQALTVNLYLNKEDYYEDRNVVKTYTIPGDTDKVVVELDDNTTYYYDVYSDDRTMSNWAIWPYGNNHFKTDSKTKRYPISNNPNNVHRKLLLPDNKQSSKWIAVGSFVSAGSTWDTMSAEGRNKNIVFMRNQKAIYTDGASTKEFRFGVTGNPIAKNAFYIKMYDTEDLDLINAQYEKAYFTCSGPISPEYKTAGSGPQGSNFYLPVTDTIYVKSDALLGTYIMVREQ